MTHESSNQIGQLRVVLTQHQWAEVFLFYRKKSTARAEEHFEPTAMCSLPRRVIQ